MNSRHAVAFDSPLDNDSEVVADLFHRREAEGDLPVGRALVTRTTTVENTVRWPSKAVEIPAKTDGLGRPSYEESAKSRLLSGASLLRVKPEAGKNDARDEPVPTVARRSDSTEGPNTPASAAIQTGGTETERSRTTETTPTQTHNGLLISLATATR